MTTIVIPKSAGAGPDECVAFGGAIDLIGPGEVTLAILNLTVPEGAFIRLDAYAKNAYSNVFHGGLVAIRRIAPTPMVYANDAFLDAVVRDEFVNALVGPNPQGLTTWEMLLKANSGTEAHCENWTFKARELPRA